MSGSWYKTGLVLGIIVLLIGVSVASSSPSLSMSKSQKFTIEGNTLYVGGSEPGNYSKIQDAIDNASDGDTVFVYDESSPYFENIIIDKRIDLIGEDRDTTVIDGGGIDNVINVSVDNVEISGFKIQNCKKWWAGIFTNSGDNKFFNNKIVNNDRGILVVYTSNNKITNNIFDNNPWFAIFTGLSSSNLIYNNKISKSYSGIGIIGGRKNILIKNSIMDCENGINIHNSDSNKIHYNFIYDCCYGIFLYTGIGWDDVIGLTSFNDIYMNNISKNDYSIELYYAMSNIIKKNNFINSNDYHATFYNSFGNKWQRNYWDDWSGSGAYQIKGVKTIIVGFDEYGWPIYEEKDVYNYDFLPARNPYNIDEIEYLTNYKSLTESFDEITQQTSNFNRGIRGITNE